ncbi:MAG: DNA topoisomerase 3 [Deltaproteobacteria bacterium]|nr:DNA topoisomerase 3 [Deltaproteobacteria bacterium]
MSRTLIIAEKPSVAGDIAKVVGAGTKGAHGYEGDDHIVSWAVGHLLEFAPPEEYDERFKRWRLKDLPIIPEEFKLKATRGSTKQLTALKRFIKAKDVDLVINACDAGREGELIFQEIWRYSGSKKPVKRLWLQSMTAAAIKASLAAPRDASEVAGLADAADCRAESDWLIGMNATRALTVRLRSSRDRVVWSAGRVQTATLALVVRRELEILAHEPEPYWMVQANFKASDHEYPGTWFDRKASGPKDRIFDEKKRDALVKLLESKPKATATETRKDSKETAPPLFDLTSLQRESNRRLGFSARRTLSIAQSLYEGHKLITYPRTDSRALPEDYEPHVMTAVTFLGTDPAYKAASDRLIAGPLQNTKRNFDNNAVSDHFAIIPTGAGSMKGLRDDERKVFDLISRRFLAAFHPVAVSTQVERITTVETEEFRTRRKVLKIPGWRACWDRPAKDDKEKEKDNTLPALVEPGVDLLSHELEEKETKPPSRLNEATLLGFMETAGKEVDDAHLSKVLKETGGLGTPATRAETIETLLSRNYAERVTGIGGRKALRATARGIRLIDSLQRIPIEQLCSPQLTADLENSLRAVQDGKRQRDKYMQQVRDWTKEIVERIQGFTYDGLYDSEPVLGTCPLCKTKVRETLRTYVCENGGKDGKCSFVVWKEVGGRYIDRKSADQLVNGSETPVKSGFFSRDGREYEASLHLTDDGRVEIRSKGHGELLEASGERVEPADVGPCPFHPDEGWLVRRGPLGYRCDGFADKKCKVNLPLEVCKRKLSLEECTGLIGKDRNTGLLEEFTSKRGRPFSATLHLTDAGRLRFEFPPRGAGGGGRNRKEFPVNAEPMGKCGSCKDGKIIETPTDFQCDNCKVRVSREVCKRELKREEATELFTKKKSALLEGFTSRAGKPFNAFLKLKKSGGHRFEWADD